MHGQSHEIWRRNWDATGDSGRHPDYGPAPMGWSSFSLSLTGSMTNPPSAGAVAAREPTIVRHQDSRLATWTRYDYRAPGLQLTYHPLRTRDGHQADGPPWAKVLRRQTFDMRTGALLDDVDTKGMTIEEATGAHPTYERTTTGHCHDVLLSTWSLEARRGQRPGTGHAYHIPVR